MAPASADMFGPPIADAGGRLVEPSVADGLIWTDPGDPGGLKRLLPESPAGWVQLPFAGIESFFEAGVIVPGRTWTCAKGIYGPATAEHALAFVLMAARRLHVHWGATSWASEARVGSGFGTAERRLVDRTVLIIGTGGIGRALMGMLAPLGPRVIGVNRTGVSLEGPSGPCPSSGS